MKNSTLTYITLFFILSCGKDQSKIIPNIETEEKRYEISGIIKNYKDSTKIKLYVRGKIIDSLFVLNEKFTFKGVTDHSYYAQIISFDHRENKGFWLENAKINIIGEKGNLKNAKISGGKIQNEENKLRNRLKNVSHKIKNYGELYDNTNEIFIKDSLLFIIKSFRNKKDIIVHSFIKEFPNSLISVSELNMNKMKWGKNVSIQLFNQLSEENKKTEFGEQIRDYLDTAVNTSIGEKYIDFEQNNPQGESIRLSEIIARKYTLIEFWGSWCGPCRKQNPYLVELYNIYNNKGFEVIGVGTESSNKNWMDAIRKDKLPWINVSDLNGNGNEVAKIYNVYKYPFNVLLDDKGIIIDKDISISKLKRILSEHPL